MTEQDRIIDRVRKLHAMAESARAIGSLAEAEAFAEAVQKTLLRYKLEAAVLEVDGTQEEEEIDRGAIKWGDAWTTTGRRTGWVERLAGRVARAHFCRILVHPGTSCITLVGKPSDRAVAEYLITTLVRVARRLATAAARRVPGRGVRQSFLAGFVVGVGDKLDAQKQQSMTQHASMALVVQRSDAALTRHLAGLPNARGTRTTITNGEAFNAGKRAGAGASLTPPVSSGATRAPLSIGAGR